MKQILFFYQIARNLKCFLKIIENYLKTEIKYFFLKKESFQNEDFIDITSQENQNSDSNPTEKFLTALKEEIIYISIDRLYFNFNNLNLLAKINEIGDKFINFEINNIKLSINTDKLPVPDEKSLNKDRLLLENLKVYSQIFSISEISLNFSNITKCFFQNLIFKEEKIRDNFIFSIKNIEVFADHNNEKESFILCPNISVKNNVPALKLTFKLNEKKIEKIDAEIAHILIKLSKQKTNEILHCVNVLYYLNNKEYKLYKKYLKKEVLKACFKNTISKGKIETDKEIENKLKIERQKSIVEGSDKESYLKINFNEIFVMISKKINEDSSNDIVKIYI